MREIVRYILALLLIGSLAPAAGRCDIAKNLMPITPTDTIIDTLHGVPIADPYRWLEDGKSQAVRDWTEAQNVYYRSFVDSYQDHDKVARRIEQLLSIGSISAPAKYGNITFYSRRDPGQTHDVLYMKKGPAGGEETAIDPNGFSPDGTMAMDWYTIADSGQLIAYGKSSSGSEQTTLFILRTDTKHLLPDTIPYTRACGLAWTPDAGGFYYTRFPAAGTVAPGDENYFRSVYFHRIGDDWHNDALIFSSDSDKTSWPNPALSPDGRYLFISVWLGGSIRYIYLDDRTNPADSLAPFVNNVDAKFMVYPLNDRFYILTDYRSPHFRVMRAGYDRPGLADWKEVIPEGPDILEGLTLVDSSLVVESMHNAASSLDLFDLDGGHIRSLALPSIGSVGTPQGDINSKEMSFLFYSFTVPSTVYRYDFSTDSLSVTDQLKSPVDLSNVEVTQVWFPSKDGTPVSMFIVGRKGMMRDGGNPTYLYGYGGFGNSETPGYSSSIAFWLDVGGVYALPNIRGGGEYGKQWHDAGKLGNKQNSFDDFIAAAEYLIDSGYTNPQKLVISGGSNGGLLIGAVLTQRPDLCKVAICSVPLLDMLRYQKFLIARLWVPEYGSSEDSAQFAYLLKYSPYQHVMPGTAYPAVLLTAGESDSRVDPLHARKMAAALQAATSSDNPILLNVEIKAGHGQGKPMSKRAEDIVSQWSFIFKVLGLRYGK